MASGDVTRRRFLETGVATAAFVGAPFVRSAHAAGSLSVAFWDHWVPGGNKATEEIARAWAEKEKVDLKIDFVTSQGNKNLLTIAAEAQAKSGHDIFAFPTWYVHEHVNQLEPVDDIMPELIKQNGNVNGTVDYLAKVKGRWMAVPSTPGSQIKGPCSRIDLMKQHAGIDVVAMYPAGEAPKADNWNMETFLKAAEACHKAGVPFGIGLGQTTDSTDTIGAFFQSFGAELVDKDGKITVKSDNVRVAMEYLRKLAAVLPPDAPAWDDASNNKWLVSGRGALICNPPSAWAVAKRDAPDIAKQCWTHGMPAGPRGRFAPYLPYLWGIWSFSRNKSAAKSLLLALSTHEAIARMVEVSGGYDLPAYEKLTTLKTWAEAEPPKGTLYHYPNPHNHQTLSIAAAPAPPNIANQIYNQAVITKMVARNLAGEKLETTLAWAENEIEGFMRG